MGSVARARAQANAGTARQRIAARREAERKATVRRRLWLAGGSVAVVLALVATLIAVKLGQSPARSVAGQAAGSRTAAQVEQQITSVPLATFNAVGAGQATGFNIVTGQPVLTSGGKPELLYMGGEYCPYCAAERWAVIVALSRFGTFSGLAPIRSAAKDGGGNAEPYPLTATWTFVKSSYTSKYLTFTPVEMNTNIPDKSNGFYTTLQTPTAAQQALLNKYDAAYQGAIPFIDYGNKFLSVGASYDPAVLTGLTWAQIADDLHNQATPVAKAALGTANYATAAICVLTNDQPASACTSVVRALQAKI